MHREDISRDKRVINVRDQISAVLGVGLEITEPKTSRSRRPITLPSTALEILKSHLERTGIESGLIFTTSSGRPISPHNLLRHFKLAIERSGLPDNRFHDLRHTHATLLHASGVHPKIIQGCLGYSLKLLILDNYSHIIPSFQTEAADQFDEILG